MKCEVWVCRISLTESAPDMQVNVRVCIHVYYVFVYTCVHRIHIHSLAMYTYMQAFLYE